MTDASRRTAWQRVSSRRPCGICGHTTWCLFAPATGLALCTRVESPEQNAGLHGWLHHVEPSPAEIDAREQIGSYAAHSISDEEATARDRLYRALADHPFMHLSEPDRQHLREVRGLDDATIAQVGFFSYTDRSGIEQVAHDLARFARENDLLPAWWRLPGVYATDRPGGGYIDRLMPMPHGALAIPVADVNGRWIAIQLRRRDEDRTERESRYIMLSSRRSGGMSSGSPLYIARPAGEYDQSRVAITEGAFKGLAMTDHYGCITLALPGIDQQAGVIPMLTALRDRKEIMPDATCLLAFDQQPDEPRVALARDRLGSELRASHYMAWVCEWNAAHGKGFDDARRAGATFTQTRFRTAVERLSDQLVSADDIRTVYDHAEDLAQLPDGDLNWIRNQLKAAYGKALDAMMLRRKIEDIRRFQRKEREQAHVAEHEGRNGESDDGLRTVWPYAETHDGLVMNRADRDGNETSIPLTNFLARIVADAREDDGVESRRTFHIRATLRGRQQTFQIPADKFAAMSWSAEHLGASAILYPGLNVRDHTRAAIQMLSGEIAERTVFTHLGWRNVDGRWVYLTASGAIGAEGCVEGVEVAVENPLALYALPEPPGGDTLRDAIRASLQVPSIGPDHITIPGYAAIWRAPLGRLDFSLHFMGRTGEFKSEVAALLMRHFGSGMDARHLPASWSSTGNALEALAFLAKDCVLAVDDFIPTGTSADVARFHREADRLLRAVGNSAGRQRMRADTTTRPAKPPRAVILSTGEETPRGQSLGARLLVVNVESGSVDPARLTERQAEAASGRYAMAMAGYIRWLAADYASIRTRLPGEIEALRTELAADGLHRRTPEIIANLLLGMRYFLRFAQDVGALRADECIAFEKRARAALDQVAETQHQHQRDSDPAIKFLKLLRSALAGKRAHVALTSGERPEDNPEAWGWEPFTSITGDGEIHTSWRGHGERVGWIDKDGDHLYLNPHLAFAVAARLGEQVNDPIGVSESTLRKRLYEGKLLATSDIQSKRRTYTVRRTCEGSSGTEVLHITLQTFLSPSPESDKPDKASDQFMQAAIESELESDNGTGSTRQNRAYPTMDRQGRLPKNSDVTQDLSDLSDGKQTEANGQYAPSFAMDSARHGRPSADHLLSDISTFRSDNGGKTDNRESDNTDDEVMDWTV